MRPQDWTIPECYTGRERERIARRLEKAGVVMLTHDGGPRPFLVCGASFTAAARHGIDADAALKAVEGEGAELSRTEQALRFGDLLFLGFVPFDPLLERDDVDSFTSADTLVIAAEMAGAAAHLRELAGTDGEGAAADGAAADGAAADGAAADGAAADGAEGKAEAATEITAAPAPA